MSDSRESVPRSIDGETAWKNVLKTSSSRWVADRAGRHWARSAAARLERAVVIPEAPAGFSLLRTDPIFTIGSCFARNIENFLRVRGYSVALHSIKIPGVQFEPPHSGVVLNKFTTPSMLNELRWALDPSSTFPETSFVEETEGQWVDLQLVPEIVPVAREVAVARRATIHHLFRKVIECRVVIITLGLVEVWKDNEAGVFLNRAPGYFVVRKNPGRFSLHTLDYRANREALEEMYTLLHGLGHEDRRFVITVSPVPMSETFTGQDVLVANAYSKSTLRAVAGDFARDHDDVDYFPSHEAVAFSDRRVAFMEDLHHVDQGMIDLIVNSFLHRYSDEGDQGREPGQLAEERLAKFDTELLGENASLRAEISRLRERVLVFEEGETARRSRERFSLTDTGRVLDSHGEELPVSASLRGSVEAGEVDGGNVRIGGWAAGPAGPDAPVAVIAFHGGTMAAQVFPSLQRLDVKKALGIDDIDSGFEIRFPTPAGILRPVRVFCVSAQHAACELNYLDGYRLRTSA
jgi:hypothetical protein